MPLVCVEKNPQLQPRTAISDLRSPGCADYPWRQPSLRRAMGLLPRPSSRCVRVRPRRGCEPGVRRLTQGACAARVARCSLGLRAPSGPGLARALPHAPQNVAMSAKGKGGKGAGVGKGGAKRHRKIVRDNVAGVRLCSAARAWFAAGKGAPGCNARGTARCRRGHQARHPPLGAARRGQAHQRLDLRGDPDGPIR